MTEEVRQALRICPLGLRQAIDRLPDAGAMEELALSEGLFVDIGGASTEVVRFAQSRRSCCAAFWSRQRSAPLIPCRK